MSEIPMKRLWRRGEVREFLGVSDRAVTEFVQQGLLKPIYITDGKRAFFRRSEVIGLGGGDAGNGTYGK